uniref:ORF220 protein n=1 Tax=Turritis glabra TaxID=63678 RepID=A0A5H2V470_TURGL|nr:ORF220 protein [Turritis glabra]
MQRSRANGPRCADTCGLLPVTTDIVLGYAWLATLGDTRMNWGRHTLSFRREDQWVTLAGDPSLVRAQISLNSMERVVKEGRKAYLLELTALFAGGIKTQNFPEDAQVKQLLEWHENVFEMPQGLPPKRGREHAINLKEGAEPVNIRPYRYTYTQKDEIEKLVREMLEARIIQPSISPYSSPVLLVQKKDGGWPTARGLPSLKQAHGTRQVPNSRDRGTVG